jgi:hypothetical protein
VVREGAGEDDVFRGGDTVPVGGGHVVYVRPHNDDGFVRRRGAWAVGSGRGCWLVGEENAGGPAAPTIICQDGDQPGRSGSVVRATIQRRCVDVGVVIAGPAHRRPGRRGAERLVAITRPLSAVKGIEEP